MKSLRCSLCGPVAAHWRSSTRLLLAKSTTTTAGPVWSGELACRRGFSSSEGAVCRRGITIIAMPRNGETKTSLDSPPLTTAFLGLGAMGYPMAGHMAQLPGHRCLVWNRTPERATRHALEYGSVAIADLQEVKAAEVVVMCVPTSAEDALLVEKLASILSPGTCLVSCTSGEPAATKRLAEQLRTQADAHFLDCPVSGGPRGASAGTLTGMLGSSDNGLTSRVLPVLQSFCKKVVECGPIGAGHAVKAINNALNVTHLMLGVEGLLALQKMGVDPDVALQAINGSSGRSLQTEVRIPQEVLTRKFEYGFKLPLMAKDCRIAAGVLQDNCPSASLLRTAIDAVQQAAAEEPDDADYTRAICRIERQAGEELRGEAAAQAAEGQMLSVDTFDVEGLDVAAPRSSRSAAARPP